MFIFGLTLGILAGLVAGFFIGRAEERADRREAEQKTLTYEKWAQGEKLTPFEVARLDKVMSRP